MAKISKENYYLNIAKAVALKSTCQGVAIGCLIVKNDQIISTGYVGAPRKTMDCLELGFCIRRKKGIPSGTGYEMCRSVHAEMNAIINAARAGVSLLGGDMYVYAAKKEGDNLILIKGYPCLLCKKMIINAGFKRFICNNKNKLAVYKIDDWIEDWKTLADLTEDGDKYFVDYGEAGDNP